MLVLDDTNIDRLLAELLAAESAPYSSKWLARRVLLPQPQVEAWLWEMERRGLVSNTRRWFWFLLPAGYQRLEQRVASAENAVRG